MNGGYGWMSATIIHMERSKTVCVGCTEPKMHLVLRIDSNPPSGFDVGDEVSATECLVRACSHSYIVLANKYNGLDG